MTEKTKGEAHKRPTRRIVVVLSMTAAYMVLEVIGGFMSNSLSLLADAGHMLADVVALSIALLAFAISSKPPNHRATFGYYRAEVIGALFNGVVLLFMAFLITKEAIARFFNPETVQSSLMIMVALGGLFINVAGLFMLRHQKSENLNLRGAWLHLVSDMLGSMSAVVSGLLIYFFGWNLSDAITSIAIAGLVSYSAIKLVTETLWVLMEHTPAHLDVRKIGDAILAVPGTVSIHDLHIWTITSGKDALSVHIVAKKDTSYDGLLQEVQGILKLRFNIAHTTIQIEGEKATSELLRL